MGKARDLTEFERGLIVGARSAGCSITDTAKLFGFSRTAVCRVYREWCGKKKTCSERSGGRKRFVDEVGEKQMERVVEANSRASVTEIQRLYNCIAEKPISLKTTQRALKRLGYMWKTSRRVAAVRKDDEVESSSSTPPKDKAATDSACNNTQPQRGKSLDSLSQDGCIDVSQVTGSKFVMMPETF